MSPSTPLSADELAELDNFLLADPDQRLAIDETHGFLTALIVGHDVREQEAWLEDVWGVPDFADAAEQRYLAELLLRMRNDIAEMFESGQYFEPLVLEEEGDDGEIYEIYEGWCFGFMLAVADDQGRWQDLPKDQQALLEPIAELALLHTDEQGVEMSDEEYGDYVELLPGSVAGLFEYFSAKMN